MSKTLRVTLETVTPLLLYGADGRKPELRPPPFRGAMRYWWRAALGGIIGDRNLKRLHELESGVFGSTDRRSPLSVRLGTASMEETRAHLLPHKSQVSRHALEGSFELIVTQLGKDDALVWDAACASLELALTFGGLGQRSRRGYGTLGVRTAPTGALRPSPSTSAGWQRHVTRVTQRAINAAVQLAVAHGAELHRVQDIAQYPCATDEAIIRFCTVQAPSAMRAVSAFMRKTKKRKALGGINPRQASPLWVRPIQTGAAQFDLLCVVLPSRFAGFDYTYVKEFLDAFDGQDLHVKGWNTL